jgi:hypothetical protein
VIKRRRHLIAKHTEVVHRECALLARVQMIADQLKHLARQILIDIRRCLFRREVCRRGAIFTKHFGVNRYKRGVKVECAFDPKPASFAFGEMIAHAEHFRRTQTMQ